MVHTTTILRVKKKALPSGKTLHYRNITTKGLLAHIAFNREFKEFKEFREFREDKDIH